MLQDGGRWPLFTGMTCRSFFPIRITFAAMKNRKKQLGVGVGLVIGVIIGILADNLVMGIGIGLAIGIAMSFELKG